MFSSLLSQASLPQPMCIYYGQALDGYGIPYLTNATVTLVKGTNQIARQVIHGSLSPGVNFALYVHLDDGSTASRYSPRALRSGDIISIYVNDSEGQKTIMENQQVPPVGKPGQQILIHVTAAEDSNGDGLPDPWEYELIANSGGRLTTLNDVKPGDDLDGDGMTNLEEYLAGTFAWLPQDYLAIREFTLLPSGARRISFWSVAGKAYNLLSTTELGAAWAPAPVGLSEDLSSQLSAFEGTGGWLSVYVAPQSPAAFFRIAIAQ
jgi:hypothetical protein